MSDDTEENKETVSACLVCGAEASPLASNDVNQKFASHLTDYDDPHRTLSKFPSMHYGESNPRPADGWNDGDWYLNTKTGVLFSYAAGDDTASSTWTAVTRNVEDALSGYVKSDGLLTTLAGYLKTTDAESTYATKSEISSLDIPSVSNVVTRKGDSSEKDIDAILAGYLTTTALDPVLAAKQNTLTAGSGISISAAGVISATGVSVLNATANSDGLMSKEDKQYVESLRNGTDEKMDKFSWGSGLTYDIETNMVSVTIDTSVPEATTSKAGLMSADDKASLDQLKNAGGFSLAQATFSVLGGVKVASSPVLDSSSTSGSARLVSDIPGWAMCSIGAYGGHLYSKYPLVSSDSVLGLVKAQTASSSDGYEKCQIVDGTLYSLYPQVATAQTAGLVKGTPFGTGSTAGYAEVMLKSDGTMLYKESPNSVLATSSTAGVVKVGGMAGSTTGWTPIQIDSTGVAMSRSVVASSSEAGLVKVDVDTLTDTNGWTKTRVDASGYLYSKGAGIATATAAGAVMVDSQTVDATATDGYVLCRVDKDGRIYSKGYDDAISAVTYLGAGHDLMKTVQIVKVTTSSGDESRVYLDNNTLNRVQVFSANATDGTVDCALCVPYIASTTNARDFFVVLDFQPDWTASNTLKFTAAMSYTRSGTTETITSETVRIRGAKDSESTLEFKNVLSGSVVVLYFTEIYSGTFCFSMRDTKSLI